ncbi:UNVERIFIED_CONTAM: hypothetical protein GTU68_063283, partial [Idotea baltica]|nr:hypothetical protein [Idotea baltica]
KARVSSSDKKFCTEASIGASGGKQKGVFLNIRLQPNSSENALREVCPEYLRWSVTAKAIDGAANAAMILSVSKWFKVTRSSIELVGGKQSRNKRLFISDISLDQVNEYLSSS